MNRALRAADEKSFAIGDAGSLKLSLPDGWTGEVDSKAPPTITLKSAAGKHVVIQITPLGGKELNDAGLKAAAQLIRDHWPKDAAETKPSMQDVRGKDAQGYVVTFADASIKPQFKFITAGAVKSGTIALAVRVFCDDKNSADHTAAMELIRSLSVQPAQPAPGKDLRVKSPDGTWALVVPGGWKISEDNKSVKANTRQLTATSDDGDFIMTLFIEPAGKTGGDAAAARDFYLTIRKKNSKPMMEHLKQENVGEAATLEYDQGDEGFKEHSINAYLSHAGSWVDVHVYKSDFDEAKDRPMFDRIVKGLKLE